VDLGGGIIEKNDVLGSELFILVYFNFCLNIFSETGVGGSVGMLW